MPLSNVWFLLIGFLFVGYAILDGFDLGAGVLHLFVARNDDERRSVFQAIAPVWDGNEVWLITAGGALFAAFPLVYATVFSGLYLAIMLLLATLILRAISIEFRSLEESRWWRRGWDLGFALGSTLAAFLFGVALGNVLRGLAIDPVTVEGSSATSYAYLGGFAGLLNPFSVSVGVFTVALAAHLGSGWLVLKTDGPVQARARVAQVVSLAVVAIAFIGSWALAFSDAHRVLDNYSSPLAWIAPFLTLNVIAYLVYSMRTRQDKRAFFFSAVSVVGFGAMAATSLFPNLVPAVDKARSLTVDNAHSSDITLTVMLAVALMGMPIVIAYTVFIYWKFRGKVKLGEASY